MMHPAGFTTLFKCVCSGYQLCKLVQRKVAWQSQQAGPDDPHHGQCFKPGNKPHNTECGENGKPAAAFSATSCPNTRQMTFICAYGQKPGQSSPRLLLHLRITDTEGTLALVWLLLSNSSNTSVSLTTPERYICALLTDFPTELATRGSVCGGQHLPMFPKWGHRCWDVGAPARGLRSCARPSRQS